MSRIKELLVKVKELHDDINNLMDEIDRETRKELEVERGKDKVFVPKEIWLAGSDAKFRSIFLLNSINQGLVKFSDEYSYCANNGLTNENTGSNYYLKKVSKPEANKLYFVTDWENIEDYISKINSYIIMLNDNEFVYWIKSSSGNHFWAVIDDKHYENYYEVVMVE